MRHAPFIVPLLLVVSTASAELPSFDFTPDEQVAQWTPRHDVRNLSATPEGARFEITASGIQQTWPIGSDPLRQGLLPDSFNLRAQSRNDAAINPGTLQANAARFYRRAPIYDFHAFRSAGLLLHAPGRIANPHDSPKGISFRVESWSPGPYYVLIVGLKHRPIVQVDGHEIDLSGPNQYIQGKGRAILQLKRRADVQLSTAPPAN